MFISFCCCSLKTILCSTFALALLDCLLGTQAYYLFRSRTLVLRIIRQPRRQFIPWHTTLDPALQSKIDNTDTMQFSRATAAALIACLPVAFAQTSTSCDPTNTTCPADTGLDSSTYSADFTSAGANASWTAAAGSTITYNGTDGAIFTIEKEGQAPTLETDFYIFCMFTQVWEGVECSPKPSTSTMLCETHADSNF